MKRLPECLVSIGIVLLSMVILLACASTPQPQSLPEQRPGLYVNGEYRFTVEYPDYYLPEPLQGDDVFRAVNTNPYKIPVVNVTIADAQAGEVLDANAFIKSAQKSLPGSKRFKVLSEKMVTLNNGAPGLTLVYKWTWTDGMTKLQTATMWVLKDGKSISANATTILGGDTTPEMLLGMVSSIKLY